MHAEFVKWADQSNAGSDRGREFEKILGYHLEQAYKYLAELGPIDEAGAAIGRDGGRRRASAGSRAFARGDMHAAANLFGRAAVLLGEDEPERLEILPELGEALLELGNFERAREVLDEAARRSEKAGNTRLRICAQVLRMRVSLFSAEPGDLAEQILRLTDTAVPLLERENAYRELARTWRLIGFVHGTAGRYGKSSDAVINSAKFARLAGDERLVARNAMGLSISALLGPTPVVEAITECERIVAAGLSDRLAEGKVFCTLAVLRAMNGEFEQSRLLYRRGREVLRDLGQAVGTASTGIDVLLAGLIAGDLEAVEREVKPDFEFLANAGETFFLSTMAALLARVVRDQGRDAEAMTLTEKAEAASAPEDVESQAAWRSVRAPILARMGRLGEAEDLARSAVTFSNESDSLPLQGDTLVELAEVLRIAGRRDEALQTFDQALVAFKSKGDKVSAAKVDAAIAQMKIESAK
jgi:tetratricopeptide (TPR) repeat protein